MKTKSPGFAVAAAAAMSLMTGVASAQSLLESLQACASETRDSERLRCYDEQMAALGVRRGQQPAPTAAALPSAAAESAPASQPGTSAAVAAPSTQATSPAPAPATTASAANVDDFGLAPEARHKKEPMVVTSRVRSVSARPRGELSIELENGQVWVENERRSTFRVEPGEAVTIRSGMLGSFFLSTESKATARVTRVR